MAPKRLSRQQSRLQTRERLLEAAAQVFSRQGFAAASVEEIAEEAGYSKGAVYSNFASKEELFLTLLDRHLEAELRSVAAQIPTKGDHQIKGPPVQRQSFPVYLEERRTWNILTLEFVLYALRHPAIQQQLAQRYRAARGELAALLRAGALASDIRSDLPGEYLAWALIALGIGLALQAYLEPAALPADLYSTITGLLLHAPREPEPSSMMTSSNVKVDPRGARMPSKRKGSPSKDESL